MQSLSRRSPEGAGAQLHEPRIHHGPWGLSPWAVDDRWSGLVFSGPRSGRAGGGGAAPQICREPQQVLRVHDGAPPHLICTSGLVREREPRQGKVQPGGSGEGRGSRFVRRVAPEPGGAPGRPPSGHFLVGIGRLPVLQPLNERQGFTTFGSKDVPPSVRRCMEFNGIQVLSTEPLKNRQGKRSGLSKFPQHCLSSSGGNLFQ